MPWEGRLSNRPLSRQVGGFISSVQDLDNLFRVDYHTRLFEKYPNLAPGGLVYNRRYFGLDNLAAIEFDPDAGAYDVIHSDGIILAYKGL
jgi:hypothetical protein